MSTLKKLYAGISKTETLDDGTIRVWGYASSTNEDADGETITAEAMKAALPDYMKWANVREMHQAKAAGTAIEAEVQADGRTWFGAHIIDSEAVRKVKAGVYKGFSIGGKVTLRDTLNKSVIKGIKLVEVSLVDRPANPEAVFTVVKAEMAETDAISQEQLHEFAFGKHPATLQKSLFGVQDFAGVLCSLGWICRDAQDEADFSGAASPVPAQLRAWLAAGIEIFKTLAAAEADKLLAGLKSAAGEIDVIEQAQRGSDLAKAGAKFSQDAKDKLAKAHQAVKEAADHLAATGYEREDDADEHDQDHAEDKEHQPKSADSSKSARPHSLQKMASELELAKAEIGQLASERERLAKRIRELEARPEPGKGVLRAIGKGEEVLDTHGQRDTLDPVTHFDGQPSDAATLIKFIHQNGAARVG